MKRSIFISYSNVDLDITKQIVNYLETNGYKCFVSYRDIPVGKVWASAIADALEECQMMVSVYSEYYNKSNQVDREIEICCDTEKKPIVTFRLSDVPMEGAKKYFLKNLSWIDALEDYNSQLPNLLNSVMQNIGPASNYAKESINREDKIYTDALSSIRLDSDKFNCYIGGYYNSHPAGIGDFITAIFVSYIGMRFAVLVEAEDIHKEHGGCATLPFELLFVLLVPLPAIIIGGILGSIIDFHLHLADLHMTLLLYIYSVVICFTIYIVTPMVCHHD